MKQQELERSKEYKYGFTTDIESVRAPKGLNEEVIRFISKIKKEPNQTYLFKVKQMMFQVKKLKMITI